MAILVNVGRVAIAMAVKQNPLHMAWGSGSAGWDATPVQPTVNETGLVAEIGRRAPSVVSYCVPDELGSIVIPMANGLVKRYSVSETPSNSLYLRFAFDGADAPNSLIRETAVFMGTTFVPGLPPGKMYFPPEDIVSHGTLLVVERATKVIREAATRQAYDIVITF